jgi:hypothetical protein
MLVLTEVQESVFEPCTWPICRARTGWVDMDIRSAFERVNAAGSLRCVCQRNVSALGLHPQRQIHDSSHPLFVSLQALQVRARCSSEHEYLPGKVASHC